MTSGAPGYQRLSRSTPWIALLLLSMILAGAAPTLLALPVAGAPHSVPASPTLRLSPVPIAPSTSGRIAPAVSPQSPRGQSAATCQDPMYGDDIYDPTTGVNGLTFWPLYPFQGGYPCFLTSQDPLAPSPFNDEQHATFSSSALGSATRWTVPIRLPVNASYNESDYLNDFYVGMVVAGNSSSLYGQSYLQVVFTPVSVANGQNEFYVTLTVLALFDSGSCGTAGLGPGLTLDWNGLNACETDLLSKGDGYALAGPIPGGEYLHVTFNGANPNGITVYVNDSTQPKYSASYTLGPSIVTNQSTFTPYYQSSCTDLCYLNWSMPYGEGFGVDLNAATFNTTQQAGMNPIWVGAPEYFNDSGYEGDFSDLSLESGSGGCSGVSGVIPCPAIGSNWGYPYFQYNGTWLLFGSSNDYNWTTLDFGGQLGQFNTEAEPTDFNPLQIDEPSNSSQVGYIPSGSTLTVSVRAQDFGSVGSMNLSYTLPDGTIGTVTMGRTSGNASIGIYSGQVPSNGGDGTILYSILARSNAGTSERLPDAPHEMFSVVRGTIPQFTLAFSTNPAYCGTIQFDGLNYSSNSNVTLPADSYTARAYPCYPYIFSSWSALGINVGPVLRTSSIITLNLTANGTINGIWRYVRPHDTITLEIDTNQCGSISLNRTVYNVNTTVKLFDGLSYPLTYSQCAANEFSGWVPSDPVNLTILGGSVTSTLTLHGNGSLQLTYLPSASGPVSLVMDTVPAGCGGILFRGAGYTNGTAVAIATGVEYPIEPDACSGWGLLGWNATAGLTVSGNYVSAQATGVLTAIYYEETIVTVETYPAGCGYVTINDVSYYNDSELVVANGSTFIIQAFPCSGTYFSGWHTTGGVFVSGGSPGDMTVYYSGVLEAVFLQGHRSDFVAFITNPSGCGEISYDGINYSGSQYIEVPPNSVGVLAAYPCVGYGFVSWSVGGAGITINNITINSNDAIVNGSGSITANFHPLVDVTLLTAPATCGTIAINGLPYSSGTTIPLPAPDIFDIATRSCAHYRLAYWTYTAGAGISVANGTLSLSSASIITAHFELQVYTVVIDVSPFNCGSLEFSSSSSHEDYTNNTTVASQFGTYNITAKPCTGFHLLKWIVTGGVSVASNSSNSTILQVAASGNLTAVYQPLPPDLHIALPPSVYAGSTASLTANVTIPVPPYTYTYLWSFGDGTNATTQEGFTTHTYANPGTYQVRVTVIDPYHRTSNATGTITVISTPNTSLSGIGTAGYVAIGVAVVAVAGALVLGRRRTPQNPPPESGTPSPKPSSPPSVTPPAHGEGTPSDDA